MIKRHIRAKVSFSVSFVPIWRTYFFELMLAQGNGCYTYAKMWQCV